MTTILRINSHTEYHADRDYVSSSMLETFIASPLLYRERYITRVEPSPAPTPAMVLGTLVHCQALTPERFGDYFAVAPKCDRRTKAGKTEWESFAEQAGDRQVITADLVEQADRIISSARQNPSVVQYIDLEPGRNELPVVSGNRKAMFDRLLDDGTIVELKTCRDPSPNAFSRDIFARGYYRRAAFYWQVARGICEPREFIFVAIGTEPPYDSWVYTLDERSRYRGTVETELAMERLARCIETNEWEPEHWGRVLPIGLPAWATSGGDE